jgi:hypothetical protein
MTSDLFHAAELLLELHTPVKGPFTLSEDTHLIKRVQELGETNSPFSIVAKELNRSYNSVICHYQHIEWCYHAYISRSHCSPQARRLARLFEKLRVYPVPTLSPFYTLYDGGD